MKEVAIGILFFAAGALLMLMFIRAGGSVVHIGLTDYICYPANHPLK